MIQGSVHRIFNSTIDWQSFDVAFKKTQEIWTKNHYPIEWSSIIFTEKMDKIVRKRKSNNQIPQIEQHLKTIEKSLKNEAKPMPFVQDRRKTPQTFANKLKHCVIFKSFSQQEN